MVGLYRCRWLLVSALLARLVTQENLMLFFDPAAERPFPIFAQSAQFYHHPVAQAWWYGTHSCCFDGIIGIQLVCVVSAFFPRCEHRFKQHRWKSSQSWCLARSFCLVQGRQARVYGEADHSNCQCVSSSNRGIWSWSKISADAWVVRLGDGMVHIINISHQYEICTDLSSFRMESNQKKIQHEALPLALLPSWGSQQMPGWRTSLGWWWPTPKFSSLMWFVCCVISGVSWVLSIGRWDAGPDPWDVSFTEVGEVFSE